jgi:GNAT superfamily N-acetyltransferase
LEPTNPPTLRSQAARPVLPLGLGLGLAPAVPITARTALAPAPAPAASRRLQLGQFSPPPSLVVSRRQPAQVRLPLPLKRPELPMWLDLATPSDLGAVLGLIEDARGWLKDQGKDQWANPWPDEKLRDARVLKGLENKKTWILRHGDTPAATVTIANWHNPKVWVSGVCQCDLTERAVYLHRLITARKYAGRGLGKGLIDWAAERARARYGAKWVRIDVWGTNTDLHRFYQNLGFTPCGKCPDPSYPSGALFQKPLLKPGRSTPLSK